jgi:thiosulfate/3-mercaptopyruvate sulfurtransferase
MIYTTLISAADLAAHLDDPDWAIVDCRFALTEPALGRQKYLAGHIPGAVYADLNQDLSGPPLPGKTGRHPLPAMEDFVAKLSVWGIDERVQVVAYDDASGMYAGRLWWMLRWLGHERVAVLDGDIRAWMRSGGQVVEGEEQRPARTFMARPRSGVQVTVEEMVANLASQQYQVFDVRDEKRYAGEPHPLDTRSGHIPGARSAWYMRNLDAAGKFLSPEQLRTRYRALLGDRQPEECVFYCGSGVSVHHDLLALAHAGFSTLPRVYIGSWSEWTADPNRPVAIGEGEA